MSLVPLAWDIDHSYSRAPPTPDDSRAESGILNPSHILMSVKHATMPFYSIQFHPESIYSSEQARLVVFNWWELAKQWNQKHRRIDLNTEPATNNSQFITRSFNVGTFNIHSIRQELPHDFGEEIVVLDSEMSQYSPMGNYSIIGFIYPDTLKISYNTGRDSVVVRKGSQNTVQSLRTYGGSVFSFLKEFMESRRQLHDKVDSPFWGGLMGYISYEACLGTLDILSETKSDRPNIQFAFIERSIVVNHTARTFYVPSIKSNDHEWVDEATTMLASLARSDVLLFMKQARIQHHVERNQRPLPRFQVSKVTKHGPLRLHLLQ
jgi:para-aminobenzoate synthetase